MKFRCDACQARYTIADETVRGKALKIRCKFCSHVMVIQGQSLGTVETPASLNPTDPLQWFIVVESKSLGPLSEESVARKLQAGSMDQSSYVWKEGMTDWVPISVLVDPPAAWRMATAAANEDSGQDWYVAFDGESVGPLREEEIARHLAAGTLGPGIHLWRAGMPDWQPLAQLANRPASWRHPGSHREDPGASPAVEFVGQSRAPVVATGDFVEIITPDGRSKAVFLEQNEVVIGRTQQNELQLNGNGVSKCHARLFRIAGSLFIEDLDSCNGTFLNGRRISSRKRIQDSDEVIIGGFRLAFGTMPGDQAAETSATRDETVLFTLPNEVISDLDPVHRAHGPSAT